MEARSRSLRKGLSECLQAFRCFDRELFIPELKPLEFGVFPQSV